MHKEEEKNMWKSQKLMILIAVVGIVFLLGAARPGSSEKTSSTSAAEDPRGGKPPCCMLREMSTTFGCIGDGPISNPYICAAFYGVVRLACGADYVCPQ